MPDVVFAGITPESIHLKDRLLPVDRHFRRREWRAGGTAGARAKLCCAATTGAVAMRALCGAMLSVVIETRNDEDGLARTLSSLVAAAVEGVVREVIVCDLGSDDQTHRVADHAGCHYLREGGVTAGIARARSEWLLLLEPGARMIDGWGESATHHAAQHTGPARFSRSAHGKGPFLSRLFSRARPLSDGLLITRRQASALARAGTDAAALARSASARRLGGEIVPAPRRKPASS